MSDFLRNRVQRVVLPEGVSFYGFVTGGVPQGNVLGPLLFLLYINDVVDLFTDGSCIKLYADDVIPTLLRCNRVGKFAKGAQTWQSSLSSEKCCDIRLSQLACKSPVNYHINDVVLNTVDIVRDLGISIDNKLTFVEHINLIVRP